MKTNVVTINFKVQLVTIDKWIIAHIPEEESVKLPSRGQVYVVGTINGYDFHIVLEPDGRWSHWFKIDKKLQRELSVKAGDMIEVEVTTSNDWPEPEIPTDFSHALAVATDIHELWASITPMARWEWIRWVNATSNTETRQRRVEVSVSKMRSGKRRPCCFNLAACTDPDLSKSGRLMQPASV